MTRTFFDRVAHWSWRLDRAGTVCAGASHGRGLGSGPRPLRYSGLEGSLCPEPSPPLLARFPGTTRVGRSRRFGFGAGVGQGVALERGVVVHARPGTDHAAEDGAPRDGTVMGTGRLGRERSNRKEGNQPGRAPRIISPAVSRTRAEGPLLFLDRFPFTGVLFSG